MEISPKSVETKAELITATKGGNAGNATGKRDAKNDKRQMWSYSTENPASGGGSPTQMAESPTRKMGNHPRKTGQSQ